MSSSLYHDRESVLHRLHPLTKLFATGAFFVAVFSLEDPRVLWPYPALLLALALAAGTWPNLRALRSLLVAIPAGALLLWSFFFAGGTPLFSFGPLHVSVAGIEYGLGMALKLVTFLLLNVLLLSTTRVEELTAAFSRMGLPYRAGFALTLAFRLVPVFVESAQTVLQAQSLRRLGEEPRGLLKRIRRTAPGYQPLRTVVDLEGSASAEAELMLAALPPAVDTMRVRADRMAVALDMRGFGRTGPRSGILELQAGWPDALAVLVAILAPLASLLVRRAGLGLVAH